MSLSYDTYEEGIFKCLLSIAKSLAVIASAAQCTYEAEHPEGLIDDPDLKTSPSEDIEARLGKWTEFDDLYSIELL